MQLLQRTSRVVRLTPAGRTFLPEARRLLHLAESAAVSTRRTAAGYGFLPELITTARERLPGVDFVLEEMVTAEQVEGLASHRIDVALLRPPVRREFESVRVLREPLLAALPAHRTLSFVEVALFCVVRHLPFREVLDVGPWTRLGHFCSSFGARESARATEYRFDAV